MFGLTFKTFRFLLVFFLFLYLLLPWRKSLFVFSHHISLLISKRITCIFRPRSICSCSQLSSIDSFLKSFLMVTDQSFDFAMKFFFLLEMLVVYLIQIISASCVSFIGQSHLHLLSFLF